MHVNIIYIIKRIKMHKINYITSTEKYSIKKRKIYKFFETNYPKTQSSNRNGHFKTFIAK